MGGVRRVKCGWGGVGSCLQCLALGEFEAQQRLWGWRVEQSAQQRPYPANQSSTALQLHYTHNTRLLHPFLITHQCGTTRLTAPLTPPPPPHTHATQEVKADALGASHAVSDLPNALCEPVLGEMRGKVAGLAQEGWHMRYRLHKIKVCGRVMGVWMSRGVLLYCHSLLCRVCCALLDSPGYAMRSVCPYCYFVQVSTLWCKLVQMWQCSDILPA